MVRKYLSAIQYHRQSDGLTRHRYPQKADRRTVSSIFRTCSELAATRGVASALITFSHTEHHAIACIVLDG